MVERTETNYGIKKRKWGEINGKEIYLFTITNSKGSVLQVTNYGAAVTALTLKDNVGSKTDVLLGYELLEDYIEDNYYMGTVVGRYANRIEGSEVLIDGNKFNLSSKEAGYHLHGGKIGFNKKVWDVLEIDSFKIKLRYYSPDGEEGFPGNLEVIVSYFFDEENTWTVDYTATTDKSTLLNLTHHAYFNLDGHQYGSILKHKLKINAEKYLPVTGLQVPTGDLADVHGTPFDFIERKTIGRHINDLNEQLTLSGGFDHSWVLEEVPGNHLKYAATLEAYKSGIQLNVFTTEPALHLYSGNFLDNITGKSKVLYKKRSGLCLETQHFPDAPNNQHFPSTILRPGEIFRSKTIFQFLFNKDSKG
ncbi:MAG TPA: aldose epimerase family protein [Flavisolibacter sp.]|nr:aldose epimerase family protein [Flavisolibacter sp.]